MHKSLRRLSLVFFLPVALVLSGCDSSGGTSEEIPDLIPQVAFSEASAGRFSVDASSDDVSHQLQYVSLAPILQSFKGNSTIKGGENYSVSFFGSTMTFDIESQSGGSSFLFKGTMDDGSGWLNVTYTQSSKTFTFEQCLFIEESSEGTDYVIYAEGSDIQMDNSGYFQGWYDIAFASECADGWEINAGNAEIYRGEMNDSGQVGTGFAIFSDDDADATTGTRYYIYEGESSMTGAPTSISKDNLSDWADFLSSSTFKSKDSENGVNEGFWEIRYHLDDSSDYVRISDDTREYDEGSDEEAADNTFTGFKLGFEETFTGDPATRADLTGWRTDSLIIDAIEAITPE